MGFFTTKDGNRPYLNTDPDWLVCEHVLQRFRDTWVITKSHPYLVIDEQRFKEHCSEVYAAKDFVVFTNAILFQNMQPKEIAARILSGMFAGGTNAGMSQAGRIIVEGPANSKARNFIFFNDHLGIGLHPYSALGTRYIHVDLANDQRISQREFAELVVVDGKSRPRSEYVDFAPLAELQEKYYAEYLNGTRADLEEAEELASLMDSIFVENAKILAAAERHHLEKVSHEQPIDYDPPELTKYGRLTHSSAGTPLIEIAFSLLHYENAIVAFHELKVATSSSDLESAFRYGVSCVVAIAACVEAIANKLVFNATGQHPGYRDRRKPSEKIKQSADILMSQRGLSYQPLVAGDTSYDVLERLRMLRNALMHSTEQEHDIDPLKLTAVIVSEVSEESCRKGLAQLRLAVAHIFDQLDWIARPIVTDPNFRWFEDFEVP